MRNDCLTLYSLQCIEYPYVLCSCAVPVTQAPIHTQSPTFSPTASPTRSAVLHNGGGISQPRNLCTMPTHHVCSYDPHCRITEEFSVSTEKCGATSCTLHLHHLCQGEFESKFEDVLGIIETMGKRCVSCLL